MGESTKKSAAKKPRKTVAKKPRKTVAQKPRKTAAQKRAEAEVAQEAVTTSPEKNNDEQPEVGESGQSAEGLSEYKPKQRPLKAAGLDQHAEHAKREAERDVERKDHNKRTGDVSRQG